MALLPRLFRLKPYFNYRQFSHIAKPDSEAHLAKRKIQTALSFLETNKKNTVTSAEQILYLALSDAVSTFSHSEPSSSFIPAFLHELKTQPSLLCSLLDELKARPDLRKERFFCHFITLYGQAGMFDSAIQTFKDMAAMKIAPSTESLNVLLRASFDEIDKHKVIQIFSESLDKFDITPNVETYNILLEGFVPSGYYRSMDSICSLLEQMDYGECRPNDVTSNIIMDGLRRENLECAAEIIRNMVGRDILSLDDRVYSIGIESLCKLEKTEEALNLFDLLLSQSLKPNADNYQHLINLCCKEGVLHQFMKLHEHRRYHMGAETYRSYCETLFESLCKYGAYEEAYTVCKDCISEKGCAEASLPDLNNLKSLMRGLIRTSKYDIGRQLSELMEKNGLEADLEFYNLKMECLSEHGKLVEAKALFEGLDAKGLKPDATTYRHMINAFSNNRDIREARRLYFGMIEQGIEPDMYSEKAIIKHCSDIGDYETVLAVYKNCNSKEWFMEWFYPRRVFTSESWNIMKSLVIDHVRRSKYIQIRELLEMMQNQELEQRLDVYKLAINTICGLGKASEVKKFIETVPSKGIGVISATYEYVIDAFGRNLKFEEVRDFYNDMREKYVKPTKSCYQILIKYLTEGGYYDTALEACESCMSEIWFQEALIPTRVFLNGLGKILKHEDVLKLVDLSEKHGHKEDISISICNNGIFKLCCKKKNAEAKALCGAMVSRGIAPDAKTYTHLISMFVYVGDAEELMKFYNVMREKRIGPCRDSYETIIKFLVERGDSENALQVCEHCMTEEWFQDFFFSLDPSRMKSLFSLVTRIAKVRDEGEVIKC